MVDQQKEKKTPACPKWLMPEAKAEWRRLAKKIHIADEDIAAFAGYCQSYARWQRNTSRSMAPSRMVRAGCSRRYPLRRPI